MHYAWRMAHITTGTRCIFRCMVRAYHEEEWLHALTYRESLSVRVLLMKMQYNIHIFYDASTTDRHTIAVLHTTKLHQASGTQEVRGFIEMGNDWKRNGAGRLLGKSPCMNITEFFSYISNRHWNGSEMRTRRLGKDEGL